MRPRFEQVVANSLGVAESSLRDDLCFRSIAEWSSENHVALMLALEDAYDTEITEDLVPELTSIAAIRTFVLGLETSRRSSGGSQLATEAVGDLERSSARPPRPAPPASHGVHRGLADVFYDRTLTTAIGKAGTLLHSGYSIRQLADHSSFEEMVYLLLHGELPVQRQLDELTAELIAARSLPEEAYALIQALEKVPPMAALRTVVSALPALESAAADVARPADDLRPGLRLISQIPLILTAHHAARRGLPRVQPSASLSHAANFLYLLEGRAPSPRRARILDRDFVLHADHGSNASSFVARIAAGAEADLHAAITAAIATFSGALHGGALEKIAEMLEEVGRPEGAAEYVDRRLSLGLPVFGFGHRVYRAEDARNPHLRQAADELSARDRDGGWLAIVEALTEAMSEYSRHGVSPNVDLYTAVVYQLLGIPRELFVAVFAASRMAGWLTQILEQRRNNILIRPRLRYVGEPERAYLSMENR